MASTSWRPASSLLTGTERNRASRFTQPSDAAAFLFRRAFTRIVLGRSGGRQPGDLVLSQECPHCGHPHHGKPRLTSSEDDLEFSVSRSGSVVAVAVTVGSPIGFDIECAGLEESGALVEWTRKEAVLKCIGIGLALDPRQLVVSAVNEPPAVVHLPPRYGSPAQFDLRPVHLRDDVIGHLAVFGGRLDIVVGDGAPLLDCV